MKSKIEWKNYLVELIVVFVSISAAFMLNNWKENNDKYEMEEKYLTDIKNDIKENTVMIDSIIVKTKNKIDRVKNFMSTGFEIKNMGMIGGDMMELDRLSIRNNTYETIKFSGNLNVISDFGVRKKIIDYYKQGFLVSEQEKVLENWIMEYGIPFFFENFDLEKGQILNNNKGAQVKFKNLIFGYSQLLNASLKVYEDLQKANQNLLKIIN